MSVATKAISRRITSSIDVCPIASHRGDFETCPHCDAKAEMRDWYARATVLCTAAVMHKVSSVAVVTECAKCFTTSWVHQDLLMQHYRFPADWRAAIKKEFARRNSAAREKFGRSLCARCTHLESGVDERSYSCWKRCEPDGSNPARTECRHFTEKPIPKAKSA